MGNKVGLTGVSLTSMLIFFLLFGHAVAGDASDRQLRKIFIDNTVSYPGHEFSRYFIPMLTEMTGNIYFDSVTLKEGEFLRSGKLISIEHREATIFQTVVYAGDQYMRDKAKRAAAIVSAKLSQAQIGVLFSQGGDLAGDEL